MLAMPCSQNRDLKCNRICKLPASSSCLDTFYNPYSSFLKLRIFTLFSHSGYCEFKFFTWFVWCVMYLSGIYYL